MIEEQARVVAVEDGFVMVQTRRGSACGQCASKKDCGSSTSTSDRGRAFTEIRIATTLSVEVGDTVVLGIDESALVKGALLLYLFPLIAMLVGGIIGDYGSRALGIHHELFQIILGVAGLASAIALTRYSKQSQLFQQRIEPVIVRSDARNSPAPQCPQ